MPEENSMHSKIEELIKLIARAVQIRRMYQVNHPMVKEALDHLLALLTELLVDRQEITIGIIGEEFAFEKEPLYALTEKRKGFVKHLKALGVNKLTFSMGVDKRQIGECVSLLAMKPESLDPETKIAPVWESRNLHNISIGEIGYIDESKITEIREKSLQELLRKNYRSDFSDLTSTFKNLKSNKALNVESARQIVEGLVNNLVKNRNLLLLMTSMRRHDEDVFEHGINVAVFTMLQAEVLGLEEKYYTDVGMASLLHDIGKLSEEEEEVDFWMSEPKKTSPTTDLKKQVEQDVKGAKILLETDDISPLAAIAAFEHNIKYDLSGYPMKLYGKKLNLVSMMIAISNYYDKLRGESSYYEEGGPERAYKEMMDKAGTHFHPDLLKNFFSVIGVFPPGTLVELDTGEIALVIQASTLNIKRPQVEILYNNQGEKYDDPQIVNLMEKNKKGKFKRSIVKSISPIEGVNAPE